MNTKNLVQKITLWAACLALLGALALTLAPAAARAAEENASYLPLAFTRQGKAPYQPALDPINNYENGSFSVIWSESPSRLADEYLLQQAADPDFSTQLQTACTTTSQSCHLGPIPAGTYYYRLKGHNPWGDSAWSTARSVTILLPETPALQPIDNPNGLGSYTVSWSSAARAMEYVLQEAASADFASPQTVYTGPQTSFFFSGKTAATYYYRVLATGNTGSSSWSSSASTQVFPPQSPELNYIENPLAYGSYGLSWSSVDNAASYTLQESTSAVFSTTMTIYTGLDTSFMVTGRLAGTYYYRVRSEGATGPSAWSTTRYTAVLPPDAPLLETIQNVTMENHYTIVWKPGFRTVSFILQQSTTPGFEFPTLLYQGTDTEYQVVNQPAGAYYYRVAAVGSTGQSLWSLTQSAYVRP